MSIEEIKAKKAEEKRFKEHTTHIRLSWQDVVFNILNYLFFGLFTLSCIFPFYYIFINTISSSDLVVKGAITFLPKNLTIQNYIAMGNVNDLWNSFGITLLRTVLGTALMVFASGLAGYLMTKQEMWHRKFWYRFLVVTMYFNAGLIPTYMVLLLMSIANILTNGMDQYLVFSNAKNAASIEVLDLYVYNLGIGSGLIPLSTVIGMVKSLISVILLFSANGISKAVRGESIV